MPVFAMWHGHRHTPIIAALAAPEPYVFYSNGYVLHMARAPPPTGMAGTRQLDSHRG
jgi:hypothetical protein